MTIIEPTAEVWLPETPTQHLARCARVCYKSEPAVRDGKKDEALCLRLMASDHLSMLRHITHYFYVPRADDARTKAAYYILTRASMPYGGKASDDGKGTLFALTGQSYHEMGRKRHRFVEQYAVSEAEYLDRQWHHNVLNVYRTTVMMVTQISTSRELNRVSPNNIAEQSTRYVNFGKKGGVCICKPHWYDKAPWWKQMAARMAWRTQEWMYHTALRLGMKPQDARGFLPLDTATQVVYTYTNRQWRHIFDLRVRETTGKAHPNAIKVCTMAKDAIEQRMRIFFDQYKV